MTYYFYVQNSDNICWCKHDHHCVQESALHTLKEVKRLHSEKLSCNFYAEEWVIKVVDLYLWEL